MIENIKAILLNNNVSIHKKMLADINGELLNRTSKKSKSSNHLSFLIDYKSRDIL